MHGEKNMTFPKKGYDVLKVGHHGSFKTRRKNFCKNADRAMVLSRQDEANRYGHPAEPRHCSGWRRFPAKTGIWQEACVVCRM